MAASTTLSLSMDFNWGSTVLQGLCQSNNKPDPLYDFVRTEDSTWVATIIVGSNTFQGKAESLNEARSQALDMALKEYVNEYGIPNREVQPGNGLLPRPTSISIDSDGLAIKSDTTDSRYFIYSLCTANIIMFSVEPNSPIISW